MQGEQTKFAEYIAEKMTHWGAQSKLARALGVQPSYISKYASSDGRPTVERVIEIADHFGDSRRDLLRMAGYTDMADYVAEAREERAITETWVPYDVSPAKRFPILGRYQPDAIPPCPGNTPMDAVNEWISVETTWLPHEQPYALRVGRSPKIPSYLWDTICCFASPKPRWESHNVCLIRMLNNKHFLRRITVDLQHKTVISECDGTSVPSFVVTPDKLLYIHTAVAIIK